MASLFETSQINKLTLANRFVRSATYEGLADADGQATPALFELYAKLARGGVGLIISGHAAVSPEGLARVGQLLIHDDSCIPGLSFLTRTVHAAGGKLAVQIAHAGLFAEPADKNILPVAMSKPEFENAPDCRVLEEKDFDRIVKNFAAAARYAQKIGIDAVQIHAAHGYLLSESLSPFFNKRTDDYGDSLENRARLLLRVLEAVRTTVGPDYPVMVKLNSEDFIDGGLTREDSLEIGVMLEKAGADAIEVSGGTFLPFAKFGASRPGIKKPEDEAYHKEAAAAFKKRLNIPIMLVGGVRTLAVAEEIVRDNIADYIALCRPLICNPDLINSWRTKAAKKSECVSDNACFEPIRAGKSLCCVTYAKKRDKDSAKK